MEHSSWNMVRREHNAGNHAMKQWAGNIMRGAWKYNIRGTKRGNTVQEKCRGSWCKETRLKASVHGRGAWETQGNMIQRNKVERHNAFDLVQVNKVKLYRKYNVRVKGQEKQCKDPGVARPCRRRDKGPRFARPCRRRLDVRSTSRESGERAGLSSFSFFLYLCAGSFHYKLSSTFNYILFHLIFLQFFTCADS